MELNTREVAALIWVFVGVTWLALSAKKNGKSYGLMNVVRTFFSKPVLTVVIASVAWVCVCVVVLSQLGAWSFENLKSTIIWFFGFAFVGLMNAPNNQGDTEGEYLLSYLKSALGISVFVGFLAGAYTLPIFLEVFILPVIFVFSAFIAMSKSRPEHKILHGPSNWVIGIIALFFIGYGILNITLDPQGFFSWKKFSDLFLPMILSILFIPFVMLLRVLMIYEMLFVRMSFWMKDKELLSYAKKRSFVNFGIDVDALSLWCESLAQQKMDIHSRNDIDESLRAAIRNKINEKLRTSVARKKGWNPYDAKDFLKKEGLLCRHYKAIYDGWGAESNSLKAGSNHFSTIRYCVNGDEDAAQSLRLKLFMWKGEDVKQAEKMFARLCILLASRAVPHIPEELLIHFSTLQNMDQEFEHWRFNIHQEVFDEQSVADYQRTFEIKIS